MAADALELIVAEHEGFRARFDRYEEIPDDEPQHKRELVDALIADLVRHGYMEEEVLYPFAIQRVPDSEEDVREEIEEHHVLEVLMAELVGLDASHRQFDAKVEVLVETCLHHFEEEEQHLFPLLRDRVAAEELAALLDPLRAARDRAPTEPDPTRQSTAG